MKKITAAVLSAILLVCALVALTACGSGTGTDAKTNVSLELITDAKTVSVTVDSTQANTVFDFMTELKTAKKVEFESSQSDAGQDITGLNGTALAGGTYKFYVKTSSQENYTESTDNVAKTTVVSGGSYRLVIESLPEVIAGIRIEFLTAEQTNCVTVESTQAVTVLDLLQELKTAGKIQYESVPSDYGEYLTSINGLQLAANEWVHISIKSAGSDVYEDATLGVSSLQLATGTAYRFDIQTF